MMLSTVVQLGFGKNYITPILTVCNSRRLKGNMVRKMAMSRKRDPYHGGIWKWFTEWRYVMMNKNR